MTITLEQAKKALHEAVEQKGADYVYQSPDSYLEECAYSTTPDQGSAPSCIVGHVIAKLDPETFAKIVETEWSFNEGDQDNEWGSSTPAHWDVYTRSVGELTGEFPDLFADPDTVNLMAQAQYYQDVGHTWGEAEEAALGVLEERNG